MGVNVDGVPKPIVPCGAIANSLFNGRSNLEFLLVSTQSDDFTNLVFFEPLPKVPKVDYGYGP